MTSFRKNLAALLLGTIVLQSFAVPFASVARADESSDTSTEAPASNPSDTSADTPSEEVQDTESEDSSDTPVSAEISDETETRTDVQEDESSTVPTSDDSPVTSASPAPEPVPAQDESNNGSGGSTSTGTGSAESSDPVESPTYGVELTGTTTPGTQISSTTPESTAATTTPEAGVATTTTATTTGPVIQSGTAVALANILNIVNTNVVNSVGNALLLNYTDQVTGPIDLRNGTPVFSTSNSSCALFACASTDGVSVNLSSDANIHNAVVLNATSGGNEIDSEGNAVISTGDALAGLNLINLANTNIVDSNYLLVTLNAFRGIQGDIVFPSLTNLFSSLAQGLTPGSISVNGSADVNNTIRTNADSGGNETVGAGSSTIATGSTTSTGNVFNQINTNMIGGSAVSILFRIQGSWAGRVFGAPAGLQWIQGPDGMIALLQGDGTSGTNSLSQITASSTTNIDNDVNVMALTGANRIQNADSALITTGNALASANVLNIANTNVVGKNWIMAIVNIFGDFEGDIAFGRPDLWVGEQVEVPSFIGNGSEVTYKYSVINNGDSVASNVRLTDSLDTAHIELMSSTADHTLDSSGHVVWDIGTLPAGGAVEVRYTARVMDTTEGTDISNSVRVEGYETDNNPADNTDSASFSTSRSHGSSQQDKDLKQIKEQLEKDEPVVANTQALIGISRSTKSATSKNGSAVPEQIRLQNTGTGMSEKVRVYDLLQDEQGKVLSSQQWDVPAIAAGEGVQLAYSLAFSANAPSGTYYLSTIIMDENGTPLAQFIRNGTVMVENQSAGKVVGWSASLGSGDASGTEKEKSLLETVFPGVAIAHAAGSDGAAAAGSVSVPGLVLFSIAMMLVAAMAAVIRKKYQI